MNLPPVLEPILVGIESDVHWGYDSGFDPWQYIYIYIYIYIYNGRRKPEGRCHAWRLGLGDAGVSPGRVESFWAQRKSFPEAEAGVEVL